MADETTTTTTTTTTTPINMEALICTGIISILEARAYIIANQIPILAFADNQSQQTQKYIVVNAKPARRIQPNYWKWEIAVEISALTHVPNDKNSAYLERLYSEIKNALNTLTPATLGAAAGLTIDGIVAEETAGQYDININTDYQIKTITGIIYLEQVF